MELIVLGREPFSKQKKNCELSFSRSQVALGNAIIAQAVLGLPGAYPLI
jgi:hypothetical protein